MPQTVVMEMEQPMTRKFTVLYLDRRLGYVEASDAKAALANVVALNSDLRADRLRVRETM
jgi:hypothetical protein